MDHPRLLDWACAAASVAILSALPASASAQNTAFLPLGARTGTMGGTGVAFGDDAAMPVLNPAGLANTSSDALSLSLSVYSVEQTTIDGFFAQSQPPDYRGQYDLQGNELSSSVVRTIPTALTYMWHFGEEPRHVVGLSLLSPRSLKRSFDGTLQASGPQVFDNVGVELIESQETYYVGPSYATAVELGAVELRAGASVFVAYSDLTRSFKADTWFGPGDRSAYLSSSFERFENASSYDLVAIVGLQATFVDKFSVGLALHTPSAHLAGSVDISERGQRTNSGITNGGPSASVQSFYGGDYVQASPLRLAVGVSADLGAVLLAADVTYTAALSAKRFGGEVTSETIVAGGGPASGSNSYRVETNQSSVVNFNLGAEFIVSQRWVLRVGGFSDFTATEYPPRSEWTARTTLTDAIDRFGLTAGVTARWGVSDTTIGFSYIRGTGDIVGADAGNDRNNLAFLPIPQRFSDATSNTYALSIAGTVDIESLLTGSL